MNKTIWIYWHQGWENSPELVRKCLHSWQKHNPSYEIKKLDATNIIQYFNFEKEIITKSWKTISMASKSDIIRINLLNKFGGIWVDSTLFCRQPLDDWLPEMDDQHFFAFEKPGSDRLISSWFLAASIDSYIINKWTKAVSHYWSKWQFRRPYYWFHYQFNELYKKDNHFRDEWDRTKKISADGPHLFAPFRQRFFETATPEKIEELEESTSSVWKLTYKCIQDGYPKGSVIDYILNSVK